MGSVSEVSQIQMEMSYSPSTVKMVKMALDWPGEKSNSVPVFCLLSFPDPSFSQDLFHGGVLQLLCFYSILVFLSYQSLLFSLPTCFPYQPFFYETSPSAFDSPFRQFPALRDLA